MSDNKDKVCAVVTTYNRKQLLLECLEALINQTRPIQAIYLIDNCSIDGTPQALLENRYIQELPPEELVEPWETESNINNLIDGQSIKLYYVRMQGNTGSSCGFFEGIKRGYEKGYDWLWLMDDDTVPINDALNNLLNKLKLNIPNIGFFCSKVLYTDETPHIMNLPNIKPIINNLPFNVYENYGLLLTETASFVSLLINRNVIEKTGLPIKEFFIWADDVEYTLRITKNGFLGFYVKESLVYHKTRSNYSASQVYDWRFYYRVRNSLWIHKLHNKKRFMLSVIMEILLTYKLPLKLWFIKIKSVIDSIIKNPRIQYINTSKR